METTQKQIVLGILAHVDSGKTTLSCKLPNLFSTSYIRPLPNI